MRRVPLVAMVAAHLLITGCSTPTVVIPPGEDPNVLVAQIAERGQDSRSLTGPAVACGYPSESGSSSQIHGEDLAKSALFILRVPVAAAIAVTGFALAVPELAGRLAWTSKRSLSTRAPSVSRHQGAGCSSHAA